MASFKKKALKLFNAMGDIQSVMVQLNNSLTEMKAISKTYSGQEGLTL